MRSASEIQENAASKQASTARPPMREETLKTETRPPMREETTRPELPNEEDPRARAARRIAEIRGHGSLNNDDGVDKFYTPPAPDGWEYNWKRTSVMGYEDPAYINNLMRTGWEPVPATRHPEMMAKGYTGAIERDGQILMERPSEISDEIRARDLIRARQQVQIKAGQMDPKGKGGIISREDAQIAPKISKNYNMAIPEQ